MNRKNKETILSIMALFGLWSCDPSYQLLLNEKPEYTYSSCCGLVTISGSSGLSDSFTIDFNGNFSVNLDSLSLIHRITSTPDLDFIYYINNEVITNNHEIVLLNGKNELRIGIRNQVPLHWGKATLELFPSSFITCNGKPVITDTIIFRPMNRPQIGPFKKNDMRMKRVNPRSVGFVIMSGRKMSLNRRD